MTRILVTGGCGFIGRNLVSHLLRSAAYEITVLDNESTGPRSALEASPAIRFLGGDIRDEAAVAVAVEGQDVVVHLAARTSVIDSIADPKADFDVNVLGGLTMLTAARDAEVARFIFASSVAPLGMCEPPAHENLAARPSSPYGAAKLALEGYCSAFYHAYGLPSVALRFSNAYGPGRIDQPGVIGLFIRYVLAGKPLTIYGSGEQTRDFLYVDDLCRMIQAVVEHDPADPASIFGRTYQVGTGRETSINDLVDGLRRMAATAGARPLTITRQPARPGEVLRSYSDSTRFTETFGCVPSCALEAGLKNTWRYFESVADLGRTGT